MLVVNFFGGPGCGKSTAATGLFNFLKNNNVNTEYVSEYAKDAVWSGSSSEFFSCQQKIWGEQSWRLARLRGKVDVVVTDSPLILNTLYTPEDYYVQSLNKAVKEDFESYDNLNFLLKRVKKYNPIGRNQNESEAIKLDFDIKSLLDLYNVSYMETLDNSDLYAYVYILWKIKEYT